MVTNRAVQVDLLVTFSAVSQPVSTWNPAKSFVFLSPKLQAIKVRSQYPIYFKSGNHIFQFNYTPPRQFILESQLDVIKNYLFSHCIVHRLELQEESLVYIVWFVAYVPYKRPEANILDLSWICSFKSICKEVIFIKRSKFRFCNASGK